MKNWMKGRVATLASLAMATISPVWAHESLCGQVTVTHPNGSPTLGLSKVGAVFMDALTNRAQEADQLLGATTDVAAKVELHQMVMDQNVMKMREVKAIDLPVGVPVSLQRGQGDGYHLMLMGMNRTLEAGDKFKLTLKFLRAGTCTVEVWVESPKPGRHTH